MEGRSQDKRRSPRFPLARLNTHVVVNGVSYPVRLADLSQDGARLELDPQVSLKPDDTITIAVGRISPNINARVRWVRSSAEGASRLELGAEFEDFVLAPPEQDDVEELLEAWQHISQSYSFYETFLSILQTLDEDVLDGRTDELAEALSSVAVWLDQRLGPLNLWTLSQEADGTQRATLLVSRHPVSEAMGMRQAYVSHVGSQGLTQWASGRPYLYGGPVVVEYVGEDEAQVDLLQKVTHLLGRRMHFWSRLMMKNIALRLLGEQFGPGRPG